MTPDEYMLLSEDEQEVMKESWRAVKRALYQKNKKLGFIKRKSCPVCLKEAKINSKKCKNCKTPYANKNS